MTKLHYHILALQLQMLLSSAFPEILLPASNEIVFSISYSSITYFSHGFNREILHKNDSKLHFMPFSNVSVMRNKVNPQILVFPQIAATK